MRLKNVLLTMYFYNLARRRPDATKKFIVRAAGKQLGPQFDVNKHLTPRYKPWDQRVCLVPNGDLFKAIRADARRSPPTRSSASPRAACA